MITLNLSLNCEYTKTKYEYILEENTLHIQSPKTQYLVRGALENIKAPQNIILEYKE